MDVNQLETSPAGIVLVIVCSGWKPSSSAGIPNCTNLASYTLIASLQAFVAWCMLYFKFLIVRFLFQIESFTLPLISSTNFGSKAEFCINWCNWASFCYSCSSYVYNFLERTTLYISACFFTYAVSLSNLFLRSFLSSITLSYLSESYANYFSILMTFSLIVMSLLLQFSRLILCFQNCLNSDFNLSLSSPSFLSGSLSSLLELRNSNIFFLFFSDYSLMRLISALCSLISLRLSRVISLQQFFSSAKAYS